MILEEILMITSLTYFWEPWPAFIKMLKNHSRGLLDLLVKDHESFTLWSVLLGCEMGNRNGPGHCGLMACAKIIQIGVVKGN